jgi:hypothetical protein
MRLRLPCAVVPDKSCRTWSIQYPHSSGYRVKEVGQVRARSSKMQPGNCSGRLLHRKSRRSASLRLASFHK